MKKIIILVLILIISACSIWEKAKHTNPYDPDTVLPPTPTPTPNLDPYSIGLTYENIEEISINSIKLNWLANADNDFAYYLAGLIDGDGHISTQGQLIICFFEKDVSLAYKIKKNIGSGSVKKIKDKRAYTYVLTNKRGILYVAKLIQNKLCTISKINQYNQRLCSKYTELNLTKKNPISLKTPWLAGFLDADASFRIHLLERMMNGNIKQEVRLLLQIDAKYKEILEEIQICLQGGYLGYRESNNTYYYSTVNYKIMYNVIKYLDTKPLQAPTKLLRYLYVRKAYVKTYQKLENRFNLFKKYQEKMRNIIKL